MDNGKEYGLVIGGSYQNKNEGLKFSNKYQIFFINDVEINSFIT